MELDRRHVLSMGSLKFIQAMIAPTNAMAQSATRLVTTGAEALAASGFAALASRRVGLITNETGRVGAAHLADLIAASRTTKLAGILAPEHGFRGTIEAGEKVRDDRDAKTGVPVFSLYGAARKPTPEMLRGINMLVFDIQDIGVQFYTYISTMGLAMQAAAAARIPFMVLDRPNPLGGIYVSGYMLEPAYRSFVGQYTIPIVHGMTVGELARMIKGERLLAGLDALDLQVIPMTGWKRTMRWPATGLPWVPTSPNIPTFASALVYPGIGIVGELEVSEGRGTPMPFERFGAPWLDSGRVADRLRSLRLPGVDFEAISYRPQALPGVAAKPRFVGRDVPGVSIIVRDGDAVQPLELGIHVLATIVAEAKAKSISPLYANDRMFNQIAGTARLRASLDTGADGSRIIASWQREVAEFRQRRARYLLH